MAVNILPFRNEETPWQCSTLLRETRRVTVQNDAFCAASSARAFLRGQLPAQFLVASARSTSPSRPGGDDKSKLFSRFHRFLSILSFPYNFWINEYTRYFVAVGINRSNRTSKKRIFFFFLLEFANSSRYVDAQFFTSWRSEGKKEEKFRGRLTRGEDGEW